MVDLNGHEAGNGGYSQRKPTAHRDSSTLLYSEACDIAWFGVVLGVSEQFLSSFQVL